MTRTIAVLALLLVACADASLDGTWALSMSSDMVGEGCAWQHPAGGIVVNLRPDDVPDLLVIDEGWVAMHRPADDWTSSWVTWNDDGDSWSHPFIVWDRFGYGAGWKIAPTHWHLDGDHLATRLHIANPAGALCTVDLTAERLSSEYNPQ